jgi:glucose/arabinose dehydrogenase
MTGAESLRLMACLAVGTILVASASLPAHGGGAVEAPAPRAPFTDFRFEAPGHSHLIRADQLPGPFATPSADNGPRIVARPPGLLPQAPPGFRVQRYATGLARPRVIRRAPNGDIFVAESGGGRIRVFRGIRPDGTPRASAVFASGIEGPYGIAFYPAGNDPRWLYVGAADAVLRYPYRRGDLHARHEPTRIAALPAGGGHWTRDLAFARDDSTLFVAVGSASNADDPDTSPAERGRAAILAFDPDGAHRRIYASGIRNPSGLAVDPGTGRLWCIVNERDGLGDDLVPDYLTAVQAGGFYGWPWYYIGAHQDPHHTGKHEELRERVLVPDVLLQPHNASLQLTFNDGRDFPREYSGDIFATAHGSWNRSVRAGYEVIRVPLHQRGIASGDYEDFLTGFVLEDGTVWGRPVGVAIAADGALLVSDDASDSIWRVVYVGG